MVSPDRRKYSERQASKKILATSVARIQRRPPDGVPSRWGAPFLLRCLRFKLVHIILPRAALQPHGEDRILCVDVPTTTWPHGHAYASVLTKHTWLIRAHRGTILPYGPNECTDCQYVKVTHKRPAGQPWTTTERALALSEAPGNDGRSRLRANVPHGPLRGKHVWARLIA